MADHYVIEVRLIGEHLMPERISARDTGALIAAVEQMIASVVARDNPALGIDESEVVVGLAAVQAGSYVLQFQTPYVTEAASAWAKIGSAISQGAASLPVKSVDSLKTIRKATRKYNAVTEFWEYNGASTKLATIDAHTPIQVETATLKSRTTLYGRITRVGGEDPPRARLRLIDGQIMICNITRRDTLRIARQLGARLYEMVGVRGTAQWDIRDLSLQYFVIEELTPYESTSLNKALDTLAELAAHHYETVPDIEALVSDLRGSDEDET